MAQVVITGLLDKIALLQEQQHNTIAIFNKALKQWATIPESAIESEPKRNKLEQAYREDDT